MANTVVYGLWGGFRYEPSYLIDIYFFEEDALHGAKVLEENKEVEDEFFYVTSYDVV